jgi:DNA-binding transcriptional regulator YhcF (GntR family)
VTYEDLLRRSTKRSEMILTSELPPGTKLVQEDLSERLGVSRTPLLAAFSKLEKELLIELVPRRGAYVRKCDLSELYHFADIRLRLEPLGAREAAQEIDEAGIESLRSVFSVYKEAVESGQQAADQGKGLPVPYGDHAAVEEFCPAPILSSFNIVLISNQRGLLNPPPEPGGTRVHPGGHRRKDPKRPSAGAVASGGHRKGFTFPDQD